MNEIVDSVKRVTDIISEIAAASAEQTSGIEQINQAINQMDEVTQQNAALVEQAAAAADSLQGQAGNLSQVVSIFRLSGMQIEVPEQNEKKAVLPSVKASVKRFPVNTRRVEAPARVAAPLPARRKVANAFVGVGEDWEKF